MIMVQILVVSPFPPYPVVSGGSANGCVLNGDRVAKAEIKIGDYLRIGFTVVTFELVPVSQDPSSPGGGQPHPAVGQS